VAAAAPPARRAAPAAALLMMCVVGTIAVASNVMQCIQTNELIKCVQELNVLC
jgi:hypothetical protein